MSSQNDRLKNASLFSSVVRRSVHAAHTGGIWESCYRRTYLLILRQLQERRHCHSKTAVRFSSHSLQKNLRNGRQLDLLIHSPQESILPAPQRTDLFCGLSPMKGGERVTCSGEDSSKTKTKEFVVPDGHVWLEGDNPKNSRDSRSYGAVPLGLLHGKVIFKLWPLKNFGILPPRSTSKTTRDDTNL